MGTPALTDDDRARIREVHDQQAFAIVRALQDGAPNLKGRGIVTSIYGDDLASGYVLLCALRDSGCELPVEVFYLPGELTDQMIEIIEGVGNVRVRLLQVPGLALKGYALKPFAIHASEFREVMWLDADNAPLRDPTFLFEDPAYKEKGSLFWRDVSGADRARFWHPESMVWTIFNVPHNDAEEFDTGQLVIDKQKCWAQLALTMHFNAHSEFYYRFVQGDKDTFRLAWWQVHLKGGGGIVQFNTLQFPEHVAYGFMPYGPFHVGRPNPWGKWGGGSVMLQRDRQGAPLFAHRTINKWKVDQIDLIDDTEHDKVFRNYVEDLAARMAL